MNTELIELAGVRLERSTLAAAALAAGIGGGDAIRACR